MPIAGGTTEEISAYGSNELNASNPLIIQGGLGVGISHWELAKAVSLQGHLGVVSGTALATVILRRLQDGDAGAHIQRAAEHFVDPGLAERILKRYYIAGGKSDTSPYALHPLYKVASTKSLIDLTIFANFAEVWLAKEGHDGSIGMNYLEKIQLPHLPSLYGAMLAGVDFVLMGAGIPREIPGALDRLAQHGRAELHMNVSGARRGEQYTATFEPSEHISAPPGPLERPIFLAIVASNVLAEALAKKSTGHVDGFIVENCTAGGHNAPPRTKGETNARGEPTYGERDIVDLERLRKLDRPFWLAGSYGHPDRLEQALAQGAAGVQVGTAFAFCDESCFPETIKRRVLTAVLEGNIDLYTDGRASPTGFPFKVVQLEGTLSDEDVYNRRERNCDLGYLRTLYRKPDGSVGYRCPAEPVQQYVSKEGLIDDTTGRKCLCNALVASMGRGQVRESGALETPIVTAGDDLTNLTPLINPDTMSYSVRDVVDYLTSAVPTETSNLPA